MNSQIVLTLILSYHPVAGYEVSQEGGARVFWPQVLERCVAWPNWEPSATTTTGKRWFWTWECVNEFGEWVTWDVDIGRA